MQGQQSAPTDHIPHACRSPLGKDISDPGQMGLHSCKYFIFRYGYMYLKVSAIEASLTMKC